MNQRERQLQEKQLEAAMSELVLNEHFRLFIEQIRQQRLNAVADACMESTVASQRASMAAIGEIRCYTSIIEKYDQMLSSAEELRDRKEAEGNSG